MSTMRFETNIGEHNLIHWGEVEVLKEFIQNAVYAKSILGDEISITYENGEAVVLNAPHGFGKGKLIMGESEQRDVVGAPGQFGIGLKEAMAVAKRMDLDVYLMTTEFELVPQLEPSSLDRSLRTLVFYIDDTVGMDGTVIKMKCSKKSFEDAKSYFAVLNGIDESFTKKDCIIQDVDNTVYVNGVKITEVPSIQSYNFTNAELINRDRTSIDMEKVKKSVKDTLASIRDANEISSIMKCVMSDSNLLESQSGVNFYSLKMSIPLWKEAAKIAFGDRACIADGSESDTKARYRKFTVLTSVPSQWSYFFREYLNIPYTSDLDCLQEKPKNVHVKASGEESNNLGWAKRLVKMYYHDYGTVRISDHVYDSFGVERIGLYDGATDTTWLKRSLLIDKQSTFCTLLHETIHRKTGASDNTTAFTQAWEEACWGILNRGRE